MARNLLPKRDYNPRFVNRYVPALQYSGEVAINGGIYRCSLGAPAAADTDGLLDGVDTTATSGTIVVNGNANLGVLGNEADARYGRNVTFTGAGAGAKVVTIVGRDYLGQPMRETITGSGGAGAGLKAFKWVDQIILGAVAGDSDSDFGWGDVLGLPYKTVKILSEEADGVDETSLGTFAQGIETDPQTATTGDPRGTYDPNASLNGSKEITITAIADVYINANGNGGLHGIRQYY